MKDGREKSVQPARSNLCVIPNQCSHWCGNLPCHRDHITSKEGDCHASVRYFIAMTWNSGVGISLVIETVFF